MDGFEITEYRYNDTNLYLRKRGDKWAICSKDCVFSHDGFWIIEPHEFSRTKSFVKNCYHDTLESAANKLVEMKHYTDKLRDKAKGIVVV